MSGMEIPSADNYARAKLQVQRTQFKYTINIWAHILRWKIDGGADYQATSLPWTASDFYRQSH